jgi:hypothetical protein
VQWFDDDVVVHNLHGSGFFSLKKFRNFFIKKIRNEKAGEF